jgi:hypothetical protein
MPRHSRATALIAAVLAVALVGCGRSAIPGGNAAAPPTARQAGLIGRCDGVDFPVSALGGPADAERGTDAVAHALAAFLANPPPGPTMPPHGWLRLQVSATGAFFAHRAADGSLDATVSFDNTGGTWVRRNWGSGRCGVARVVPGWVIARWDLQSADVDQASTSLPIVYASGGCGAGARFDHAGVEETADAVTVTVYLRPVAAPTAVPGGPPVACAERLVFTRRTITLPHPLNGRALYDGSTIPPRPATAAP